MKRFVSASQRADTDKAGCDDCERASAIDSSCAAVAENEAEVKNDSRIRPRASFSTFTGLLSPAGRRRTFTSQSLTSSAQSIKDMLSLASLKSYGELDEVSDQPESGLSDDGSDAESGRVGGRPKMLYQPSGIIKGNGLDDTDLTESTDLSERSLHEASARSLPNSPPTQPRRRMSASAPSSPFVVRKDKEGSTTKWVTTDSLSAPHLELNIQLSNKRASHRNRRRRSTRSAPSITTPSEK